MLLHPSELSRVDRGHIAATIEFALLRLSTTHQARGDDTDDTDAPVTHLSAIDTSQLPRLDGVPIRDWAAAIDLLQALERREQHP